MSDQRHVGMEFRGTDPSTLPSDADNYDVWCERCQRVHKHFTLTREDFARIIADGAKKLADEIDRLAAEEAIKRFG
jgi:hypothetical protein